jgi:hypothetical protein
MLLIASGDIPFRRHCCRLRTTQKKNKAAETHSPRDPPDTASSQIFFTKIVNRLQMMNMPD